MQQPSYKGLSDSSLFRRVFPLFSNTSAVTLGVFLSYNSALAALPETVDFSPATVEQIIAKSQTDTALVTVNTFPETTDSALITRFDTFASPPSQFSTVSLNAPGLFADLVIGEGENKQFEYLDELEGVGTITIAEGGVLDLYITNTEWITTGNDYNLISTKSDTFAANLQGNGTVIVGRAASAWYEDIHANRIRQRYYDITLSGDNRAFNGTFRLNAYVYARRRNNVVVSNQSNTYIVENAGALGGATIEFIKQVHARPGAAGDYYATLRLTSKAGAGSFDFNGLLSGGDNILSAGVKAGATVDVELAGDTQDFKFLRGGFTGTDASKAFKGNFNLKSGQLLLDGNASEQLISAHLVAGRMEDGRIGRVRLNEEGAETVNLGIGKTYKQQTVRSFSLSGGRLIFDFVLGDEYAPVVLNVSERLNLADGGQIVLSLSADDVSGYQNGSLALGSHAEKTRLIRYNTITSTDLSKVTLVDKKGNLFEELERTIWQAEDYKTLITGGGEELDDTRVSVADAYYSLALGTERGADGNWVYVTTTLSRVDVYDGELLLLQPGENATGTGLDFSATINSKANADKSMGFGGIIANAAGKTITLSGSSANTYTGDTWVLDGTTLAAGKNNALGQTSFLNAMAAGAQVNLSGYNQTLRAGEIAANTLIANGAGRLVFAKQHEGYDGGDKFRIHGAQTRLTRATVYVEGGTIVVDDVLGLGGNVSGTQTLDFAAGSLHLTTKRGAAENIYAGFGRILTGNGNVYLDDGVTLDYSGTAGRKNTFSGNWYLGAGAELRVVNTDPLSTAAINFTDATSVLDITAVQNINLGNTLVGAGQLNVNLGANTRALQLTAVKGDKSKFEGTLNLTNASFELGNTDDHSNQWAISKAMLTINGKAKVTVLAAGGDVVLDDEEWGTYHKQSVGRGVTLNAGGELVFTVDMMNRTADGVLETDDNGVLAFNAGTITIDLRNTALEPMIDPSDLLSQDDIGGNPFLLARAGKIILGSGVNTTSTELTSKIMQGGEDVATAYFGSGLAVGKGLTGKDELFFNFLLERVDIHADQTLTLVPRAGATGHDADFRAEITGAGNLNIDASAAENRTIILSSEGKGRERNSYTGNTTITNGTVKLGANNAFGITRDLTVEGNATIDFNGKHQVLRSGDVRGRLTGSGALTFMEGDGDFVIARGNRSLEVAVRIEKKAVVELHDIASLGDLDKLQAIYNEGTIRFANAIGDQKRGIIGGGIVEATGNTDLRLNGKNVVSRWRIMDKAIMTASLAEQLGEGKIEAGGFFVVDSATDWQLNNEMSGNGWFNKLKAGELTIARANEGYTGATNIYGGRLILTDANGVGSKGIVTIDGESDGLRLALAAAGEFKNTLAGKGDIEVVVAKGDVAHKTLISGDNRGYQGNWLVSGYAALSGVADSASVFGSGKVEIRSPRENQSLGQNHGRIDVTTAQDFIFSNALSGNGLLMATVGSDNEFSFGTGVGAGFNGMFALSAGRFELAGNNTIALTNAALRADGGSVITVGAGDQHIGDLIWNGGVIGFDVSDQSADRAKGIIEVDKVLDLTNGGVVRLLGREGDDSSGAVIINPDDNGESSLLTDQTTGHQIQLVSVKENGTVIGDISGLTLQDSKGNPIDLDNGVTREVREGTVHVANAHYNYELSKKDDGLYLGYGLYSIALLGQGADQLTLTGLDNKDYNLDVLITDEEGYHGNLGIRAGAGGSITLSRTNTYTGETRVLAGRLVLGADSALGTTSKLDVETGAVVDFGGNEQELRGGDVRGHLTGKGKLIFVEGNGDFVIVSDNADLTASVTINGNAVVELRDVAGLGNGAAIDNAGVLRFAGAKGTQTRAIAGKGTVEITDKAELTLASIGNEGMSGTWSVQNGVLIATASDQLGSGIVNINAGSGTFAVSGDADWQLDNIFRGGGLFEKRGAGTVTIAQANEDFAGRTEIDGGVLVLANVKSVGDGGITINSAGGLELAFGAESGFADFGNVLSGSGTTTISGNGININADNNGYTGKWIVTGHGQATSDAKLGSGALNIAAGGQLDMVLDKDGYTFERELTGSGILKISSRGDFGFGNTGNEAFTGTVWLEGNDFDLAKNEAVMAGAVLQIGKGNTTHVVRKADDGAYQLRGIILDGGILDFSESIVIPNDDNAAPVIELSDADGLEIRKETKIMVKRSEEVWETPSLDQVALLDQDDGIAAITLIKSNIGNSLFNLNLLTLVDEKGERFEDEDTIAILNDNDIHVATGSYGWRLGIDGDSLNVGYRLTQVEIVDGETFALRAEKNAAGESANFRARIVDGGFNSGSVLKIDASVAADNIITLYNNDYNNDFGAAVKVITGSGLRLGTDYVLGGGENSEYAYSRAVELEKGAKLFLNGRIQTIGALMVEESALVDFGGGRLRLMNGGESNNGILTGSGLLDVAGGTLKIENANNDLTASVTIGSDAVVELKNVAGLGLSANGAAAIDNAGTLRFTGAGGIQARAIAGKGTVEITNGVELTLDSIGNEGMSGTWSVQNGGTLTATASDQLGSGIVDINAENGTFVVSGAADWQLDNTFRGGGKFRKDGTGTVTIAQGNEDFTGTTTINTGRLVLANVKSVGAGGITINGAGGLELAFNGTGTGEDLAFADFGNVLSGSGTTTISGNGINISADNSGYTGKWIVTGHGQATDDKNLGSGVLDIVAGGQMDMVLAADGYTFDRALEGSGILKVSNDGTFGFGKNTGSEFTGTVWLEGNDFILAGNNAEVMKKAILKLGRDHTTIVGENGLILRGLEFAGGTLDFGDAGLPGAVNEAPNMITTTGKVVISGKSQISIEEGGILNNPPKPGSGQGNILSLDDGEIILKLVDAEGGIEGSLDDLVLVDKDGNRLIDSSGEKTGQLVDILDENGELVADGLYDYKFGRGNNNGIYIEYGLKELAIVGGKTLVLRPDADATGNAVILDAKLTDRDDVGGNIEVDAGFAKNGRVIIANGSNDYTGSTTISSGILQIGASGALGQENSHTSLVSVTEGTGLDVDIWEQTIGKLENDGTVWLGGQLDGQRVGGKLTIADGGYSHGENGLAGWGELIIGGDFEVKGANAGLAASVTIQDKVTVSVDDIDGLGRADVNNGGIITLEGESVLRFEKVEGDLYKAITGGEGATIVLADGSDMTLHRTNDGGFSGTWDVEAGGSLTATLDNQLGTGVVKLGDDASLNIASDFDWELGNEIDSSGANGNAHFAKAGRGKLSAGTILADFDGDVMIDSGELVIGDAVAGEAANDTIALGATGGVTIGKNGTLTGRGIIKGDVSNAGVIKLYDEEYIGDMLTIRGDYHGENGGVMIYVGVDDEQLVTDGVDHDRLVFDGGTVSGTTKLTVVVAPASGFNLEDGLHVVRLVNGAAADDDEAFVLDQGAANFRAQTQTLRIGAYDYENVTLERKNVEEGSGDGWWLTQATSSGGGGGSTYDSGRFVSPEVAVLSGLQSSNRSMFMMRLSDHEKREIAATYGRDSRHLWSVWSRFEGGRENSRFDGGTSLHTDRYLTQFGIDLAGFDLGRRGSIYTGVMGGWGHDKLKSSRGRARADGKSDGYGAGLYATWYSDDRGQKQGAYIDGWLQYGSYDNSARGEGNFDAWSLTGSLEAGYRFGLLQTRNATLYVTPQAQISYVHYEADDFINMSSFAALLRMFGFDMRTGFGDDDGFMSRVGVRVDGEMQIKNGMALRPFATLDWHYNSNAGTVYYSGDAIKSAVARNSGEVRLGLEVDVNDNVQIWGAGSVRFGDHDYKAYKGNIGVKLKW